jgi:AcrR family transcriptional regulator
MDPSATIVSPMAEQTSARRTKTRESLIKAATEVVAEHGFDAATVDRISERAGYSVGAIYSNFGGKDDLLFAVFDGHLVWFSERLEALASAEDPTTAIGEWLRSLSTEPDQFHVFIEFWAYAVRRPEVRRKFARRMDQMRSQVAKTIQRRAVVTGKEPPLDPELIALFALALGRGLALEKLARARSVPDETVSQLLAGLLP